MAHSGVLQIYGIHQMVERHVGIAASQPHKQRCHQSREGDHRAVTERAKDEIEPDDVRLQSVYRPNETNNTRRAVVRPAALDRETVQFRVSRRQFIGQYCEPE